MPTVSVIIPTFNRSRYLPRAVFSVLLQRSSHPFELLVVDDGSTDDTLERLSPFGTRLRFITHRHNLGVSAARNTGIRHARGTFVAFLDSDDYWFPEKLQTQLDFMRENPSAQICQTEEIWIRNGRRVNPGFKHLKPGGNIFMPSLKRCLVSPSAVMMRRTLFNRVGFFDETLPACEDYDLWLRISCLQDVHLLPWKLVVRTGGHPDQLSSRYPGMDRFRIHALLKILRGGHLNSAQRQGALAELRAKCEIYGRGCLKRGKHQEGTYYLHLPDTLVERGRGLQAAQHEAKCEAE